MWHTCQVSTTYMCHLTLWNLSSQSSVLSLIELSGGFALCMLSIWTPQAIISLRKRVMFLWTLQLNRTLYTLRVIERLRPSMCRMRIENSNLLLHDRHGPPCIIISSSFPFQLQVQQSILSSHTTDSNFSCSKYLVMFSNLPLWNK